MLEHIKGDTPIYTKPHQENEATPREHTSFDLLHHSKHSRIYTKRTHRTQLQSLMTPQALDLSLVGLPPTE